MTFGSLFAGIGGFDLGLERSGMECKWQCEIDKYANQILAKHWPNVRRYNDIRQLTNPEPVDLICGGFPCQDLSMAGKRTGLEGQRSGLFYEMARIIDTVKPKWVLLENVPGLLSSKRGADMQAVVETLVECGYYITYRVLDSQNFGVAQRRRRMFIVGSLGNTGSIKVLFEPKGLSFDLQKSKKTRDKTTGTVGSLTARDFKGIGTTIDDKIVIEPHTQGEPRFYEGITPTLNTNQGGQRQPCIICKTSNTKSNGSNISEDTAYTLDCNQNQAILQRKLRRLIPLEYERLQGFPDGWTDILTDTQRYKTLGNAVTINVIEWIGKRIMMTHWSGQERCML